MGEIFEITESKVKYACSKSPRNFKWSRRRARKKSRRLVTSFWLAENFKQIYGFFGIFAFKKQFLTIFLSRIYRVTIFPGFQSSLTFEGFSTLMPWLSNFFWTWFSSTFFSRKGQERSLLILKKWNVLAGKKSSNFRSKISWKFRVGQHSLLLKNTSPCAEDVLHRISLKKKEKKERR